MGCSLLAKSITKGDFVCIYAGEIVPIGCVRTQLHERELRTHDIMSKVCGSGKDENSKLPGIRV